MSSRMERLLAEMLVSPRTMVSSSMMAERVALAMVEG
jgi:hypothetical protein